MPALRTASLLLASTAAGTAAGQAPPCVPDPLVCVDGTEVADASGWTAKRRPELLELFRREMYGYAPPPVSLPVETLETASALDGAAVRKQWRLRYGDGPEQGIEVLAYLPTPSKDAPRAPTPVFLALNFQGNHTVHKDPGIRVARCWVRNNPALKVQDHTATAASRGAVAKRWPVELLLARGYGLVTACYGDIDPDFDDGFRNGVHGALQPPGDEPRSADAWGAIGAWAWGLSRILDSLEADPDIDGRRVAVLGHSRLGKTALWAGAQDARFWMVLSNNSGCGGAAYSRRRKGETVARINKVFPHWFCRTFHGYADREDALPIDQHLLVALCAPRPVYVASAEKDAWADPLGEFASAKGADPVYRLLCGDGLPAQTQPALDVSSQGRIGYHLRSGKHDLLAADWAHYLDFADRHKGLRDR